MHPTTRVLIKTLNCDLDSSFIEGIGDAITLDDLWHYLTKYHEITEESDHVTRLDLKTISIYDILGDGYVKLLSIRRIKLDSPAWWITHFSDNRCLITTHDVPFNLTARERIKTEATTSTVLVPTNHTCQGDHILRDTKLWFARPDTNEVLIRKDIKYGGMDAVIVGYDIPKTNLSTYCYRLTTSSGSFAANGLEVHC